MHPDERDAALLEDMATACRDIVAFMQDTRLETFSTDRKLCLAVERCLEIIGEAAGRVSPAFQKEHPQIPWREIKAMRNLLAREYGHVDFPTLFRTAESDVPALLSTLDPIARGDGPRILR